MKYEKEIRDIICNVIDVTNTDVLNDIDADLQSIGMNSIEFIKIVVEIEKEFDLEFPDDKLIITQTNSIRKLCEILSSFD